MISLDLLMLPEFIDLAIVGAGPHALTLVKHLLQKKKSMRGRFLVFDPTSAQWWLNDSNGTVSIAATGGRWKDGILREMWRVSSRVER